MTITTTNDARALSAISRLLENKKRLSNQDISFILRVFLQAPSGTRGQNTAKPGPSNIPVSVPGRWLNGWLQ